MASEPPERHPVPVTLPPSLDEWLADRAEEAGLDREELLVQLAATYRAAAEDGGTTSELVNAVEGAAIDAATERVDERIGSFRSSLDSQLGAIRERIVQLKHEADEKAESSRVRDLSAEVNEVDERLERIEETVADVQEHLETLEALEEQVEALSTATGEVEGTADDPAGTHDGAGPGPELTERLEDIESKLVRVARAVVELRDGDANELESLHDTTLRELKRVAARKGVQEATCAGCEERVDLALLAEPACPHCESRVHGLGVDDFFEEPRLTVEADDGEGTGNEDTTAASRGDERPTSDDRETSETPVER